MGNNGKWYLFGQVSIGSDERQLPAPEISLQFMTYFNKKILTVGTGSLTRAIVRIDHNQSPGRPF